MNSPSRPPTTNYSRGHPTEFEQIIQEKSQNFVGREFVFTAINEFLHRNNQGYFTIIGAPGSGKSAILAKYATDNLDIVYYNVELEGKNRANEFLRNICTQLINQYLLNHTPLPDNATNGSWFLSSLLQQISEELQPHQKLLIAIDGLNFIDRNSQASGTNLFYLPRYLPDRVYFILTRRPFLREKSGLLIETPSQSLDLADYPEQNRQDIQAYIQNYLTPLTPLPYKGRGEQEDYSPLLAGEGSNLESWLSDYQINEQEFSVDAKRLALGHRLTADSENNFMYLSQIINAILTGFYLQPLQYNQLPPTLAAYYQQHLHNMMRSPSDEKLSLAVLKILIQHQTITVEALAKLIPQSLAHTIDADEYEIEEVLENWLEYLKQQQNNREVHYSLYHSSFRHWLSQQVIQ